MVTEESKMLSHSTAFGTDEFDFDKTTRSFAQEISTLSRGSTRLVFGRVYPDSADEGFTLVAKPGFMESFRELVFYVHHEDRDASGEDIMGWVLHPTPESIQKYPTCEGVTVLIIND
jgi:hypothetical protein